MSLTAFELAVLRAVGHSERPAIDITLRLLTRTPDLRLYGVAQWLLGAEVWRALQRLVAAGLLSTRETYPLFPHLRPTTRKAYSLTLDGLSTLARSDVDDIVARIQSEPPAEVPPAPDTQPDLENEDG